MLGPNLTFTHFHSCLFCLLCSTILYKLLEAKPSVLSWLTHCNNFIILHVVHVVCSNVELKMCLVNCNLLVSPLLYLGGRSPGSIH